MSNTDQLTLEKYPSSVASEKGLLDLFLDRTSFSKEMHLKSPLIKKEPTKQDQHLTYKALIVDPDCHNTFTLKDWLTSIFPEIHILTEVDNLSDACCIMAHHELDLIFSDAAIVEEIASVNEGKSNCGIIAMSEDAKDAVQALRNNRCGFILKPLNYNDVTIAVHCAINKLLKARKEQLAKDNFSLPHNKLVGIPTMEGIEFISTDEIIRCEGLQKCTRIVTTEKSDVISSYNIGEFKRLLEDQGFFSCHKSHLINLKFVKKYTREGFIFLNACPKPVPLARRRKLDFLNQMRHL